MFLKPRDAVDSHAVAIKLGSPLWFMVICPFLMDLGWLATVVKNATESAPGVRFQKRSKQIQTSGHHRF